MIKTSMFVLIGFSFELTPTVDASLLLLFMIQERYSLTESIISIETHALFEAMIVSTTTKLPSKSSLLLSLSPLASRPILMTEPVHLTLNSKYLDD